MRESNNPLMRHLQAKANREAYRMGRESRKAEAIDRYVDLERQLERASQSEEEELIHELGRLEIVYGITTDDVLACKEAAKKEKKEVTDGTFKTAD